MTDRDRERQMLASRTAPMLLDRGELLGQLLVVHQARVAMPWDDDLKDRRNALVNEILRRMG